jgi:hypothetical protein
MYVASGKHSEGSAVARMRAGSTISFMYRGCLCVVLISSAISLDRTNSVVGIPLRAQTEASARPKFPPPMTAIRTGYGGGDDAFMESSWLLY